MLKKRGQNFDGVYLDNQGRTIATKPSAFDGHVYSTDTALNMGMFENEVK